MENDRSRTMRVFHAVLILMAIATRGHTVKVSDDDELVYLNITMSNVSTMQEDAYEYVLYKVPDEELFIVGFTPLINSNVAHHMLTYACAQPTNIGELWGTGKSCRGQQTIIHGWGLNAPPLTLPKDVGFPVGRNTPYNAIMVNIHYLAKANGDSSGNQVILSRKPRKYHAGIMLGASGSISIPPKTHTVRVPFSCNYDGPSISIFAVRVHAHRWARVNSLYRVRDGEVTQVAKGNPQWPQSFYPLPTAVLIEKGDSFIGQCVYDNNDDHYIHVGSTHHDEMCNVYAMYAYDAALATAPIQGCWGDGGDTTIKLLPNDSLIVPASPAEIGGITVQPTRNNLQYQFVENWPDAKSPLDQLGQIGGIALNNENDQLVIFHRSSRTWDFPLFDGVRFRHESNGPIDENVLTHVNTRTGQVEAQWGAKMFYMPHGLTIDGRGNIWITDVALHQVLMFAPGKFTQPVLTVGEKFQSGDDKDHFCRPADVAVASNGDFFVADGYCNTRIAKFNAQGQFIKQWGRPMSGRTDADGYPMPYEWNIVHSIALDEAAQMVCGADRENFRIQCFHPDTGEFLRQIHVASKGTFGAIYAIEFVPNTKDAMLFAVSGGGQTIKKTVYQINARNGDVVASVDTNAYLTAPHDITVSSTAGEFYVGELISRPAQSVRKFAAKEESATPEVKSETTSAKPRMMNTIRSKRLEIILVFAVCAMLSSVTTITIYVIYHCQRARKIRRLKTQIVGVQDEPRSSFHSRWTKQRKGFKMVPQDSDEEGQLLDPTGEDPSAVHMNNNDDTLHVEIQGWDVMPNNTSGLKTLSAAAVI